MLYLPFASVASARGRTGTWATHLGCGTQPADVTRYWFPVLARNADPEKVPVGFPVGVDAAIAVPDDDPERPEMSVSTLIRADKMSDPEIAVLTDLYTRRGRPTPTRSR